METKRKKTLFNVIMVVLILIIAGCGIMAVGNLKGWFGKDENSVLVSQNVKGVANIQRSGVGYGLEKNVSLRDGDILETKNGTTADLSAGEENILSLNANTELEAVSVKKGDVQVSLDQGELFTDLASGNEKILFTFGKNSFTTGSGVFAISQQTGSASLDVFKDEIDLSAADGSSYTVKAGESVQITGDENDKWTVSTGKIAATSLNEYMIGKLTGCKDKDALCFTTDELQKVLDDRAAEKKAALEKSLSSSSKIPKTEDSSRKKGSSTAKAAATVTPAAEDNATVQLPVEKAVRIRVQTETMSIRAETRMRIRMEILMRKTAVRKMAVQGIPAIITMPVAMMIIQMVIMPKTTPVTQRPATLRSCATRS